MPYFLTPVVVCKAQFVAAALLAASYALGLVGIGLLLGGGGRDAVGPGFYVLIASGWANVLIRPAVCVTGLIGLAVLVLRSARSETRINVRTFGILATINVLATLGSVAEILRQAPALFRFVLS